MQNIRTWFVFILRVLCGVVIIKEWRAVFVKYPGLAQIDTHPLFNGECGEEAKGCRF